MHTTFVPVEGDIKGFEKEVTLKMDECIKHFERELVGIRTGRAHASMVEGVLVPAYGEALMPLKAVATITVPDARQILIQPWDKGVIGAIEKAIQQSDVGVTPLNDGNVIRICLPEMSSERRAEFVKILHSKLEQCRIAIRNVRKDFHNLVRECEKKKQLSEDWATRLSESLQTVTDKCIAQAEEKSARKEAELKNV